MGKKKENIVKIESGIPGVSLVVKKETEQIKIPFQTIKRLFVLVRKYRKADDEAKYYSDEKTALKDKLVKIVSKFPQLDLLSLQTEKDNLRTTVYESVATTITYDRELLKKSLGESYPGVVHEDLQLTMVLTPENPKEEVIKSLKDVLGEEAYKKLVKEEILLRVDEKKLDEMVNAQQVNLQEGAQTIDKKQSWSVKTTTVKE